MTLAFKEAQRKNRHYRIRRKVNGTVERPRLSVKRSKKNLICQLIDDIGAKTLFAFSTADKNFRSASKNGSSIDAAKTLGKIASGAMKTKGFVKIAFDRSGYLYHGRIKALADALREGGINF